MNRARNVFLLVLLCLVAAATQAQEWRGAASIAIEVKGKPQGNVPDALVILRYQQMEPPGGPRPVVTDAAGQAVLANLAEGVWEVEVSHGDFLSFVALVRLETGRKPAVQASFLQASGSSLTPIRVKFMDGKGRAPSASVPLPPEAAARLAQRRPSQPLQVPATPTTETAGPRTRDPRAPQPVMPEPELRPLPETAKPADRPSPPPLAEPVPTPGDITPPEPEVRPRPEPAPPLPEPEPQPVMPQTPAPAEPAAEPTPSEPIPQTEPEPVPPVTDPAAEPEPEPEPATAVAEPRPATREPQPATPAPSPAPVEPEAEAAPAVPEPEPAPPSPEPTMPSEPERVPPVPEPASPPRPEPVPPATELEAPRMPVPAEPEPIPPEPEPPLAPQPEAPMPETEPSPPEPEPTPTMSPTAPEPTAVLPPPGPLGPTLRAYGDRTCIECRPGEWAISVEAIAGPASAPCSASLDADGRELAVLLGGSVALELKEVAAPAPRALDHMGSAEASVRAAELLGNDSRACRIVAAVIPKAGRFRGLRMEAADASGIGDCQADRPCPVGRALWLGQPRVSREPSANVIWGLFVNEAPDRVRRARLTVYFAAPSRTWDPPR